MPNPQGIDDITALMKMDDKADLLELQKEKVKAKNEGYKNAARRRAKAIVRR